MMKKNCCLEKLWQKYDQRLLTTSLGRIRLRLDLSAIDTVFDFLYASFNVSPRCNDLLDCGWK